MAEDFSHLRGRVVFVTHSAVLSGAELNLLDMAASVPNAIVCLFEPGPLAEVLRARGIEVRQLGSAGGALQVRRDSGIIRAVLALPGLFRMTMQLIRATGPADLLYANSQKAWVICALAAALARRRTLWHLHDIVTASHFSKTLASVSVRLANLLSRVVVVNSRATGDSFIERGGRGALLRVVYNGIDPAPFNAALKQDRAALRRQLGVPQDAVIVGLFGRITPWKGQHVLLQALESLPGVHAIFVGAPLFGEHDYQRELEGLAASPALIGRIRFLGFRSDIADLMRAVDIVVHASTAPEPFGRVIVEAMLSHRPVIATQAGGVTEIIEDARTGMLIPPGDAAAMAEAIRVLCADPQRASRMAEAGLSKARTDFTVDAMMTGLRGVIAEAAGAGAA